MNVYRILGWFAVALFVTSCGTAPTSSPIVEVTTASRAFNNPYVVPAPPGPVPQERGTDLRPRIQIGEPLARALAVTATPSTLILYDTTDAWGWMGELYAINVANLASHFGTWKAKPVAQYVAGDLSKYTATVYIGSTYDEPLPAAFLDDVLAATRPVIWIYDNIWQLANRGGATFTTSYGFNPWMFDTSDIRTVNYKTQTFTRDANNNPAGIMMHSPLDTTKATVLATAVRADGKTLPWAVRSTAKKLTYLGESPFTYISDSDRYLIFSDLLFDALAPSTAVRHRALARIEDVSPESDPAALRAIADYFSAQKVPFSVAVIAVYTDPNGAYNDGIPVTIRLRDAPAVVSALKYMQSKGGTLLMHGYTHQYASKANPDSGTTGDDFEFWQSHIDTAAGTVVWDGPVTEDSTAWAAGRVTSAFREWSAAGLTAPTIWEFPHYAGSGVDARAIRSSFGTAYQRGYYFSGQLAGTGEDLTRPIGQYYPYVVTDLYGWKVLPENVSNYEPDWYYSIAPRPVSVVLANAKRNLAVRDGYASFYFHPYLELARLKELVSGVKKLGYTFVSPADALK